MVIVRLLLIGIACLHASVAAAVTADELRADAADNQREISQRESRANTGSLDSLLPADAPKSSKVSTSTVSKSEPKKIKQKKKYASTPSSEFYTPPPRSAVGGQTVVTDAVVASVDFGIWLGSWLSASLDRKVTSGDTESVELTLNTDAVGKLRTLPAGTTLFADKYLNNITRRMDMVVTHGITPDGTEFRMKGIVFDPQKNPGLAGVYVMDKKAVASQGIMKGAIAAVGTAVGMASPGVGGTAANAATQSVLSDANQLSNNNAAQAVIYVAPQALLVRVEKEF